MLYKLLFLGNRIQGIGEGAVTIAGGINGLSKLGKAFFAFLLSISLFTNTTCLRKTSPHFLPHFFFFPDESFHHFDTKKMSVLFYSKVSFQ